MHQYTFNTSNESYINKKDELQCIILALVLRDCVDDFDLELKLANFNSNVFEAYIANDFDRENSYLWSYANS